MLGAKLWSTRLLPALPATAGRTSAFHMETSGSCPPLLWRLTVISLNHPLELSECLVKHHPPFDELDISMDYSQHYFLHVLENVFSFVRKWDAYCSIRSTYTGPAFSWTQARHIISLVQHLGCIRANRGRVVKTFVFEAEISSVLEL